MISYKLEHCLNQTQTFMFSYWKSTDVVFCAFEQLFCCFVFSYWFASIWWVYVLINILISTAAKYFYSTILYIFWNKNITNYIVFVDSYIDRDRFSSLWLYSHTRSTVISFRAILVKSKVQFKH